MYEQQYSMRSKKSSLPRMELFCTQWVSDVPYGIIQTMGIIIGGVYAPITRGPWATSLTWENTREEDLNFVNVFSLLRNYYWPHGFGEEHFKILSMFFCYFVIIFPWKRGAFIWTNLNPLHPRMLSAKFGWNWPSVSGEDSFIDWMELYAVSAIFQPCNGGHFKKNLLMYFHYFVVISPSKRTGPFIWTNLYLIHPRMLVPILV